VIGRGGGLLRQNDRQVCANLKGLEVSLRVAKTGEKQNRLFKGREFRKKIENCPSKVTNLGKFSL